MKYISIRVTGKVQGVFFRQYTFEKATELGLKGFVKNMPDDSVYIEACGDDEVLSLFVDWCYTGSPRSQVENVEITELKMVTDISRFEIR